MAQTLEAERHSDGAGERDDYTPSGADVAFGEVVLLSASRIGICDSPEGIADGVLGSLAVDGKWRLKKDGTDTFALHAKVAWDDTANQVEPDGGVNDDGTCGLATAAAIAADGFVVCEINAVPMT